ncbi:helix-turn-helix domain-containing protein [uncultured Acidaminococcus sp.]|uniref:helix-turn-helix domain-containing protein n=1 Tax=uncultured Acidaminococcus sp. TaxID=352152 RepID=UPI002599BEC5|nr:helix-turn-helix transcriptional regulator [uncultured Acidaminococcus sp.]
MTDFPVLEEPQKNPGLTPWARRLRYLRKINNLSQQQVAYVLHCTQVSYGMYELDKRMIPLDKLIQLADFYHTILDYLAGRTDKPGE